MHIKVHLLQTVDKVGIFVKNMPTFLLENLLKYTSIGYI